MVRAGDNTRIVDSFDLSPTTTSPALGCTETANYEQPEDISGKVQNANDILSSVLDIHAESGHSRQLDLDVASRVMREEHTADTVYRNLRYLLESEARRRGVPQQHDDSKLITALSQGRELMGVASGPEKTRLGRDLWKQAVTGGQTSRSYLMDLDRVQELCSNGSTEEWKANIILKTLRREIRSYGRDRIDMYDSGGIGKVIAATQLLKSLRLAKGITLSDHPNQDTSTSASEQRVRRKLDYTSSPLKRHAEENHATQEAGKRHRLHNMTAKAPVTVAVCASWALRKSDESIDAVIRDDYIETDLCKQTRMQLEAMALTQDQQAVHNIEEIPFSDTPSSSSSGFSNMYCDQEAICYTPSEASAETTLDLESPRDTPEAIVGALTQVMRDEYDSMPDKTVIQEWWPTFEQYMEKVRLPEVLDMPAQQWATSRFLAEGEMAWIARTIARLEQSLSRAGLSWTDAHDNSKTLPQKDKDGLKASLQNFQASVQSAASIVTEMISRTMAEPE
jgi:hypothetical protein